MNETLLRCYLHQDRSHNGQPAWEALLSQAMKTGVLGGSAFQAMAGFGHHGVVNKDAGFFSLKSSPIVVVEFLVTEDQAGALLAWVEREGIRMFYARVPARADTIGAHAAAAETAPPGPTTPGG